MPNIKSETFRRFSFQINNNENGAKSVPKAFGIAQHRKKSNQHSK